MELIIQPLLGGCEDEMSRNKQHGQAHSVCVIDITCYDSYMEEGKAGEASKKK